MSKEKDPLEPDSKLTEPKKGKSRTQKGWLNVRAALTSWSFWISALSTLITLIAAIHFTIFFSKALKGFAKQINAFVKVGDLGNSFFQTIVTIFVIVFVVYLFFIHLASTKIFRNWLSGCGTACILFVSSIFSQIFLVAWVLVTCIVSALTLVYFLFIGAIYSFCSLVDTECFNFKVLIPAIVNRFSNNQIDMTFCQDKKEILCNRTNNMIGNFGIALTMALLTFCGCLIVQNCVVYGLGKKNAKSEKRKDENIEMEDLQ
ncbi:unnamed protein product, partial [Mesorhabditis belari]|uniref:Uncharacterized protein n=1 Tax=Mesorhabditis belari TaxID=2138241 RepID=A0AAF3ERD9_9BILA